MDLCTSPAVLLGLAVLASAATGFAAEGGLGLFEAHGDVGAVGKPGAVVHDMSFSVAREGEPLASAGGSFRIRLAEPSWSASACAPTTTP